MTRASRCDTHRLDAVEVTASGALRVPARVARVGVLTYTDDEGNTWGEFVPEGTLFAADSMATLRGVAVTDMHPTTKVTPVTRKGVQVGHASDLVERDGNYLATPLYVTDADEIRLVQSGERKDVSCGYTCDFDETPGVFDGVAYQRVQIDRVYNHLGLGPEGWGRAGTDVSLRMDGASVPVARLDGAHTRVDGNGSQNTGAQGASAKGSNVKKKLKVRGREYNLDADDEMKVAQDAVGEVEKKADADAGELAAVKAALMDALTKVAALEAKMAVSAAAEPAPVTEEMVPDDVADSIATKRTALRERAAAVLPSDPKAAGYVKLDGLSAVAIKRAVVAHAHPTMKLDGMKPETIDGMYLAITEGAIAAKTKREDGQRKLSEVLTPAATQGAEVQREDGQGAPSPSASLQKKLEDQGRAPLNPTKSN